MSGNLGGISKRHMRRLVAADKKNAKKANSEVECAIENNISVIDDNCRLPESNELSIENESTSLKEDVANWAVQYGVGRNACEGILNILHNRGLAVPKSYKALVHRRKETLQIIDIAPGQYYHFGLERALKLREISVPRDSHTIFIDVGIDGLPLYKSSNQSLWPILGAISNCRTVNPFLIGAYIGSRKPENVNKYLESFVNEVHQLQNVGIELNGRRINIQIRLFTVDTPARSFLTGVTGHTSNNGCSKCMQTGSRINKRLAYETSKQTARTDLQFSNRSQKL